jgi:chaperonin GroEL
MAGKIIKSGTEMRALIREAVNELGDAVGYTIGPNGKNVCIRQSWGNPHITKDGVTVAKSIDFKDQIKSNAAQLVKSAAQKQVDECGDGTSCCSVLTQAIYNKGFQLIAADYNQMAIKKGIDKAVKVAVEYLNGIATPIDSEEEIKQVGTISANDAEIGALIADAFSKAGKDGLITIDESSSAETTLEFSDGMNFDRGYYSPWFITNIEKSTVDFANAYVLIHEDRLEDIKVLVPLLEEVSKQGRPLLIISEDFGQNFVATLIMNKRNASLFTCPVKSPGFGQRRKEILKDLAVLTGATLFSRELANDVSRCEMEDLGQAEKIIVNRGSTTIVGGGGSKEELKARCNQIRDDIENADNDYDAKMMKERLAKLVGGVAIIKVGGNSEPEMKEKKDRVEDAMYATRAALSEGVLVGGSVALLRCIPLLNELATTLTDIGERAGALAVASALEAPIRLISQNAGGKPDVIVNTVMASENPNFGYNAATDIYEDLILSGVIDPKKVVRCAIQNAASVASMLLTTEAMIVDEEEDKDE